MIIFQESGDDSYLLRLTTYTHFSIIAQLNFADGTADLAPRFTTTTVA